MSNNNENALTSEVQIDADVVMADGTASAQVQVQAQEEVEVVDAARSPTIEETSKATRSRWLSLCRKLIPAYRCGSSGCYSFTTRRDLQDHRRRVHPQTTSIRVSKSITQTYSCTE